MEKTQALRERLNQAQSNALSVRLELQAACFAGIWAHHAGNRNLLEAGDVEEAMRAAAAIGDDNIQRRTQGQILRRAYARQFGTAHSLVHDRNEERSDHRLQYVRRGVNARDLVAAVALTVGIVGAVSEWNDRPGSVDVPPGRTDAGVFSVKPVVDASPINTDGGTLLPVAEFETRGRVLHIERFKPYQSLVNWVPGLRPPRTTLVADYGPMTDTANVQLFNFSHEGVSNGMRALFPRPRGAMTRDEFDRLGPYITNVHVIPASNAIYDQLRRVRHGELVTLRGKLVNVRDSHGNVAQTSTTAGDRDCEIMWLQELRVTRL